MTVKIDRESIRGMAQDFATAVDAHVAALNEYAAHIKGVAEDAVNPDLTPDERRVAFPPPSAHDLIECAVRQDGDRFIADYELVGPSLEVRKQRLCAQVDAAEAAEIAKVMPPRKARHWQMREQDIRTADHMRLSNHPVALKPEEINDFLAKARPAEDTTFLIEQGRRHATVTAIQRWAAKAHYDIDDLTDETVEAWKLEPFNG